MSKLPIGPTPKRDYLRLPDILVTVNDCRLSGKFCVTGGKAFFQKHDLDFKDFAKNGISSHVLAKCNDAMANAMIDEALKRVDNL